MTIDDFVRGVRNTAIGIGITAGLVGMISLSNCSRKNNNYSAQPTSQNQEVQETRKPIQIRFIEDEKEARKSGDEIMQDYYRKGPTMQEVVVRRKRILYNVYQELARDFSNHFAQTTPEYLRDQVNTLFAENSDGKINEISKSKIVRRGFNPLKIGRGAGQVIYQTWKEMIEQIGKKDIARLGFDYDKLRTIAGWKKYTFPKNFKGEEAYRVLQLNLLVSAQNAKGNYDYLVRNTDLEKYPEKLREATFYSHNSGPQVQARYWNTRHDTYKGTKHVRNVKGGELGPFHRNFQAQRKIGWEGK